MINKKIEKAINGQIKEEFYSAYLYLALSAYYASSNLQGFASWLSVQAKEELGHAMKFYHFLLERGGMIQLQPIAQPPAVYSGLTKAFPLAYAHEQKITNLINKLYELAKTEKDYAFEQFLHWFINEQVEEEATTLEISEKLKIIGEKSNGIFMLDHQLGKRTAGGG
jgi:ferritin